MSEIICHCFEVSREEIENAIREKGLKTVEEVGEATNAGTGCGGPNLVIASLNNF